MIESSSDLELRQRLQQLEASDARLRTELATAVEREAALAQIAQRINEHPLDVDGTLRAIPEAARVLTDGDAARVFLRDGEQLVGNLGAIEGEAIPARYIRHATRIDLSSVMPMARCVRERRTIAVADALELAGAYPAQRELVSAYLTSIGVRSSMAAPLGRAAPIAGSLAVARNQVRPFNATEMATLEAFAAQAAIAIETARAQQQLGERNDALAKGLERETATADILRTISQSSGELEGVRSAIAAAAQRLCAADHVAIGFVNRDAAGDVRAVFWDPIRGLQALLPNSALSWDDENVSTKVMQATGAIDSWPANFAVHKLRAREDGRTEAAWSASTFRRRRVRRA